ncbi:rod shape-determining protein RodA [Nitriliruptor alkaliphilus]|uniref:rod shape-determining protein RodA n=1 Tax=Nitriliruptor alkaliphilus TaxID=427918 RepID=UPI000B145B09|nr:rod shape-determining protein RodA [Nitriliruptor alkaliphilus]
MEVGYGQDRAERMQRERVASRWQEAYAPIKHLDPVLVLSALALTGIGLVAIYSAKLQALTDQGLSPLLYISRQVLAMVVGILGMVAAAVIDYRHLRTYAAVIYGVALVLLVLVITPLGTTFGGAQRWILIGGFQLQPSELAKIAVLIAIAAVLHERKGEPGIGAIAVCLALTMVPMGLVFLQPDLGTSIVFVWLCAILFLVGGVKGRYLIGLGIAAVTATIAVLRMDLIADYQVQRLTAFLDASNPSLGQGPGFQTRQSVIAIGSGQVGGKGLFQGTQTSLSYVPENHTDFIFTVIGEEFGFLGAMIVLGLFLVLIWRGLRIAVIAKDLFGTLLAVGVVAMLALQVFVNVGMTVGIMPVTGIPLPFVSYGGTSLIVWFAIVGLLLNVHMRRF